MARTGLRTFWCTSLSLAALATVSPAAAQDATSEGVAANEQAGGNTIVVTGLRRADELQDTPAAITAFTADTIENARILRPADFVNLTPNVNLVETQNAGNAFIIIRGITQARNSEPSVAVVVDGVQQVNPAQFNQGLFDIEQIEVLKGPQGGLYGRNAIGGAIIITTREPTDEFEGKITAGVDELAREAELDSLGERAADAAAGEEAEAVVDPGGDFALELVGRLAGVDDDRAADRVAAVEAALRAL